MTRAAPSFPRAPLLAAFALTGACVLGVGAVSAGWIERPAAPVRIATPETERNVRFLDQADGGVLVQAAGEGRDVVIEPGSGAFVRGVARVLVRERRMRGIGPATPFRMTRWSDGRLTLTDPATGKVLTVNAFGPDNRKAFSDLLLEGAA